MDTTTGYRFPPVHGWAQSFAGCTDALPWASFCHQLMERDTGKDRAFSSASALDTVRSDRRVSLARPLSILLFLGADDSADVFSHRDMGTRKPCLCIGQVL